jgi:putative glutamine amidotransferase
MTKKVLVPLAIFKSSPETIGPMHFSRETYIKKLVKYDLMPIFVSVCESEEMIWGKYQICQGVLLMGGGDLDSKYYNESRDEKTVVSEGERDILEIQIAKRAIEDKKPILGICRGCQVLAVASGGQLVQDITGHRLENMTYDQLGQIMHEVAIEDNCKTRDIIGKKMIMTNSAHHQAVKSVGEKLKIVSRSNDGVCEIIESVDQDFFCIGVQSHPEAEDIGDLEKIWKLFSTTVN